MNIQVSHDRPVQTNKSASARALLLREIARSTWRTVIVEPIGTGRLRDIGWPPGIAALVKLFYAVYAVLVLAVIMSGPLRASLPLVTWYQGLTMPVDTDLFLLVLLMLPCTFALAASAHAPFVIRLIICVTFVALAAQMSLGMPVPLLVSILSPLAVLAAVVVVFIRGRRSYSWAEVIVLGVLVLVAFLLPMYFVILRGPGSGVRGIIPYSISHTFLLLAIPVVLAAGPALSEITITLAAGLSEPLRGHFGRTTWIVISVALVVTSGSAAARSAEEWSSAPKLLGPAISITVTGAMTWWFYRRHRRDRLTTSGPLSTEPSRVGSNALTLSLLITAGVPVQVVLARALQPLPHTSWWPGLQRQLLDTSVMLWLGGVAALVFAFRASRRRVLPRAVLMAAWGSWLLLSNVAYAVKWVMDADAACVLLTVCAIAVLVLATVRRRGAPTAYFWACQVLLICTLYPLRTVLDDPLGWLLSSTGVGAVLFALIWRVLTDAEFTRRSSPLLPVSSRVLFFLAGALLSALLLTIGALGRSPERTLDDFFERGDQLFGPGLIIAASLTALATALSELGPRPAPHRLAKRWVDRPKALLP